MALCAKQHDRENTTCVTDSEGFVLGRSETQTGKGRTIHIVKNLDCLRSLCLIISTMGLPNTPEEEKLLKARVYEEDPGGIYEGSQVWESQAQDCSPSSQTCHT